MIFIKYKRTSEGNDVIYCTKRNTKFKTLQKKMCFNFIQVSVKKLNLKSLKFSVTLYLTNIQKEVFIVSSEICNEVIMMIIQYIKLIILKIG